MTPGSRPSIFVFGATDCIYKGYGMEGAINPHKERYAASRNDGPSKSVSGDLKIV